MHIIRLSVGKTSIKLSKCQPRSVRLCTYCSEKTCFLTAEQNRLFSTIPYIHILMLSKRRPPRDLHKDCLICLVIRGRLQANTMWIKAFTHRSCKSSILFKTIFYLSKTMPAYLQYGPVILLDWPSGSRSISDRSSLE